MKGPKAQRGSAKSPGPIKRCKSPAESSEPDTSHLHSSPSLFLKAADHTLEIKAGVKFKTGSFLFKWMKLQDDTVADSRNWCWPLT